MKLTDLPNFGPVLKSNLNKIGVNTPEQLRAMGVEGAWIAIRANVDPGACMHQLQALAGAAEGIPKKELTQERKAELKAFFEANK